MVDRYPFNGSLISNLSMDGGIVWTQDTLSTTLADESSINDGYVTAEDTTQYLSVLENSGEISLENLNIALENSKLEEEETFVQQYVENGTPEDQQVVIFTVEGSDELYGLQCAQDEEGNFQKYQFQLRRNEDGQLEAIPETIQLLPPEEEEEECTNFNTEPLETQQGLQIFVQENNENEHILPDVEHKEEEHETTLLYEEQPEDEVDVKPALLHLHTIKQEIHEHLYENNPEYQEEAFESVEVNPDVDSLQLEHEEVDHVEPTNDSDIEDFQLVEGIHVTGDMEDAQEHKIEPTVSANILRHTFNTQREVKEKKEYYYMIPRVVHSEKENVETLPRTLHKPMRVNPRSILKTSHGIPQPKPLLKPALIQKQNACQEPRLISKRFARGKEAIQAKNFHNFINKTTIPEVPVRTTRLPRKQSIKPVERMDEEIVVQEVRISLNGHVEAVKNQNRQPKVTEYVELSDSDSDYDPKVREVKKKRKKRRENLPTTDEESESEDSVIDLLESDEESDFEHEENSKKRRGRPTKAPKEELESPSKKTRLEGTETKPEIPCPKCDKSFPSQNSLKTHLQHHNLQNSLKRAMDDYKCQDCGNSYKNQALLKRHTCLKHVCNICKKRFVDLTSLSIHKRSHAKTQLVKTTSSEKISPKKMRPPSTTTIIKKKENNLKCQTCGKFCSSTENLTTHLKSHKEFVCLTCSAKFMSRIMLDKHVRENCVKTPSTRKSTRVVGETPGTAGIRAASRLTNIYRNLHSDLRK